MNVFSDLRGFLKVKYISIDNKLFQLHYKVTSITLLAFSAVVASKQHFGNPIECLPDTSKYTKTDDMKDLLNTYCWVQSTYTIPDYLNGTIGRDIIYPGVGPLNSRSQTRIHHRYYQWIVFLLFFQGIAFLTPHFIWRIFECGKMAMLSFELKNRLDAEDVIASKRKLLLNYFSKNMGYHNIYANCYILCEILNFINVIAQIWITDLVLGHKFRNYGSDVVKYMELRNSVTPADTRLQVDPMTKLFPRVSKCNLRLYGSGGNIQIHDAICMLPLNIINEKIYIILWFWFIFLTLISFLGLVYRTFTIVSETFRFLLLRIRTRQNDSKSVKIICRQCNFADWFVLSQLSKNIQSLVYKELINDLANQFQQESPGEKESLLKDEILKTLPNIQLSTVSKSSSFLSLPPPPPPSPPPWALELVSTGNYGITNKIVTEV